MPDTATQQHTLTVTVGEFLFEFNSFTDWIDNALRRFSGYNVRGEECLCIDSAGRICRAGKQFIRAGEERAFPIKVYRAVAGMKFRIKGTSPIRRDWLASMVAMIIEADAKWAPYMPNKGDDSLWTLDRGNNWHLQFDDVEDSRICEIRYRYRDSHFGLELFAYIEKRMRWERVVD